MSNESRCSECNTVFRRYYDLRKHVRNFHSGKLEKIAPLKSECEKTYKFSCDICQRNFSHKKHLTFHKKTHGIQNHPTPSKSRKKCPLCTFEKSSKSELHEHFEKIHDVHIETENLEFPSQEEFNKWKNSMERDSKSRYVKECGDMIYKTHRTVSYVCHRSGFFVSETTNKRRLRIQGSRKIGGFCPASIKVLIDSKDKYQVTYIMTHVGHTADLVHLNLTAAEREEIADKIASKIPFSRIINEVKNKAVEDNVQRISLLTKKDMYNIAAAFKSKSEAVRICNDVTVAETWDDEANEGLADELEMGEFEDVIISGNPRNGENEDFYESFLDSCTSDPENERSLQEKKEEMKKRFRVIVDSLETESQLELLEKFVSSLESKMKPEMLEENVSTPGDAIPNTDNIQITRNDLPAEKVDKNASKLKKPSIVKEDVNVFLEL